jgi:hypothetical protein
MPYRWARSPNPQPHRTFRVAPSSGVAFPVGCVSSGVIVTSKFLFTSILGASELE